MGRKEVKDLIEKGHAVKQVPQDSSAPDLIIHENAWRWHENYWEHIEVALKEARKGQPAKRANDEVKRKPGRRKGPKSTAGE